MVQLQFFYTLKGSNKGQALSVMWCLLGVDRVVHALQINLSITKSDLLFLKNKSLYCFDSIFLPISNRLISILLYKTLTYIFDINRPHMFVIKLEWFYNWTLDSSSLIIFGQKHFCIPSPDPKKPIYISFSSFLESFGQSMKGFHWWSKLTKKQFVLVTFITLIF